MVPKHRDQLCFTRFPALRSREAEGLLRHSLQAPLAAPLSFKWVWFILSQKGVEALTLSPTPHFIAADPWCLGPYPNWKLFNNKKVGKHPSHAFLPVPPQGESPGSSPKKESWKRWLPSLVALDSQLDLRTFHTCLDDSSRYHHVSAIKLTSGGFCQPCRYRRKPPNLREAQPPFFLPMSMELQLEWSKL